MISSSLTFLRYEKSSEYGEWVHRAVYRFVVTNGEVVLASNQHYVTFRPDTPDSSFPMPDGTTKTCAEIMADCQI